MPNQPLDFAPSPGDVRQQMERILASQNFAAANRSQRFLRYVVEHWLETPNDTLKEYAIAIEVFDRDASYDPSIDATVRVEAGRLRSRLRDYYATEGRNDNLIIEMPKGAYRVTAVLRRAAGENSFPEDTKPITAIQDGPNLLNFPSTDVPAKPAINVVNDERQFTIFPSAVRSFAPRAGAVILVFSIFILIWIGLGRWHSHRNIHGEHPSAGLKMHSSVLVSAAGRLRDAALSPDAKEIAYIWDGENEGRGDVYVQWIGGNSRLRLTHTATGFVCCASWSRDGQFITYSRCDDDGGAVFLVPILGGSPRKLTDVVCRFGEAGWPVWNADGQSLFVVDSCRENGPGAVTQLFLSTGQKVCLTEPPPLSVGDRDLALSPDRKTLAFIRMSPTGGSDIYTLSISDRRQRQLTFENKSLPALMWSADGQNIIFRSSRAGLTQLWHVAASGGAIEKESSYPEVGALSGDGRRLIAVPNQTSWPTNIALIELSAPGGAVLDTKEVVASASLNDSPQLSPNGQFIAYDAQQGGIDGLGSELWKIDKDGTDAQHLTGLDGRSGTPRWSPDGNRIAFDDTPGPYAQIYLIDADGRNRKVVTSNTSNNVVPSFSRDGKWIYFASNRTGRYEMWKKELSSGREIQLTQRGGIGGLESFDGKNLYYSQLDGSGVWRVPIHGGEEQKLTKAPHLGYWGYFSVCESGLYLVDTDLPSGATILFFNFRNRSLHPVLKLRQNPLPYTASFSSSRDGRTILLAQYKITSSITMLENFQ